MKSHPKLTVHLALMFVLVYLSVICLIDAAIHGNSNSTITNVIELDAFQHNKYLILKDGENKVIQIEPGILQVDGKPSKLVLLCDTSNTTLEGGLRWEYYGIDETSFTPQRSKHLFGIPDFSTRPPVMRFDCNVGKTSKSVHIYKGGDEPPFLYNNGENTAIIILNKTSASLPCILKYPLKYTSQYELQLFKDDKPIKHSNISVVYKPEYGYILNWENITDEEGKFGIYECRVLNSTTDDFVRIEFREDDRLHSDVKVYPKIPKTYIYANDTNIHLFYCTVSKSKFKNQFEWFLQWKNGTKSVITPERSLKVEETTQNPDIYTDNVKIRFLSTQITHVGCKGFLKEDGTPFNSTYKVVVEELMKPRILNVPSNKAIIYKNGTKLNCTAEGHPITFEWRKNGRPADSYGIVNDYSRIPNATSTITLKPFADEKEAKYTCIASNFLGRSSYDFTVKLDEPWLSYLVIVGIALVVLVIALGLVFIFFKVKMKPRKSIKKIIQHFREGIPPEEAANHELFERFSYNPNKEIDKSLLTGGGDLLGKGEFGVVRSRWYRKEDGNCIKVAVKSMKKKEKASKDLEIALENFVKEIKFWQNLGDHTNIVSYIGSVTTEITKYSVGIVLELCCIEGNMKTYLQNVREKGAFFDDVQGMGWATLNRSRTPLKTSHLMKYSKEIASAMEYVIERNLIHRDLAARNVLLTCGCQGSSKCYKDDPAMLIAKISDFGMSKDLKDLKKTYYRLIPTSKKYPEPPKLPVQWMSPEAVEDLKFSASNDVWAFGVTLWEMFSIGDEPFSRLWQIKPNATDICDYLSQGLTQPELASPEIWDVMDQCCSNNPDDRPSFSWLHNELKRIYYETTTNHVEANSSNSISAESQDAGPVEDKSQSDCDSTSTQENSETGNKIPENYVKQSLETREELNEESQSESFQMSSYHSPDVLRNENVEYPQNSTYFSHSLINDLSSTHDNESQDPGSPAITHNNPEYMNINLNLISFHESNEYMRKDSGYSEISSISS